MVLNVHRNIRLIRDGQVRRFSTAVELLYARPKANGQVA